MSRTLFPHAARARPLWVATASGMLLVAVPAAAQTGIPSLVAAGAAVWGGGKPAGARIELAASGPAVSTIVIEDRG